MVFSGKLPPYFRLLILIQFAFIDDRGNVVSQIEVSLESTYRYNPLHNDLEAYALAYGIASLLNNLFGRGKEPFWQQAYTNLVKFIILPGYTEFSLGTDVRFRRRL